MEYLWKALGYEEKKEKKEDTFYYNTNDIKLTKNYICECSSYVFNVMKNNNFSFISSFEHKNDETCVFSSYFGIKNYQLLCIVTKVITKNKNYYIISFYYNSKDEDKNVNIPILANNIKIVSYTKINETSIINYKYEEKDMSGLFSNINEFLEGVKEGKFKTKNHICPFGLCDNFEKYFLIDQDFENSFDGQFKIENLEEFIDENEKIEY